MASQADLPLIVARSGIPFELNPVPPLRLIANYSLKTMLPLLLPLLVSSRCSLTQVNDFNRLQIYYACSPGREVA